MDVKEFIKERNRMCKSFGESCYGCPADKNLCCDAFEWQEELVSIVEKWSKENPRKTRQSLFIYQHPQVAIYSGIIGIRPCQIVENYTSNYCDSYGTSQCVQCRKEYWMQEVE